MTNQTSSSLTSASPILRQSTLVFLLGLTAAGTTAQERPWVAHFQAGNSTIHSWGKNGSWGEARVGRSFRDRTLSADLGLAVSSSDETYRQLTVGLELLPFPRSVVSPFARAEAGLLSEPEYVSYVASVGAGLSVRLSDALSVRGGASLGTHGGVRGPVVYFGGLQLRW